MATFIGTSKELRRYIGPRLRNLVQQITKHHKTEVAACEHCGSSDNLESAHISGRDRNRIIDLIASKYTSNEIITIDLGVLEEKFKTEHEPIEKSILILCHPCHKRYDTKRQSTHHIKSIENKTNLDSTTEIDLLPIVLTPPSPEDFKKELLISKTAVIVSYYSDGRIEAKPWNASRFSDSSNVMGNLRSRSEFRYGNWQLHGIIKIHVKVINNS